MRILAGDIGGTNVRLALYRLSEGRLAELRRERFPAREYPSLSAVLDRFLEREEAVDAAGFGFAGAVRGGEATATNLGWVLSERDLAARCGAPAVLLNDLAACGNGIGELPPESLLVLNAGDEDPEGHGALIAAGTGLGESILFRHRGRFWPLPTEGGHTDFAPRDEAEIRLLRWLLARHRRVSYERIVSGPGLVALYAFEREDSGIPEPGWLTESLASADSGAAVVTASALEGKDEVCVRTLGRFVSLYGAEAGNLALKSLATGGVFVGGGIAPKILPALTDGRFLDSFRHKGRFTPVLSAMPVKVILDDACALLGAARAAARRAAGEE